MWEFLISIEEQFYTPQALLIGFELETPFYDLVGRGTARTAGTIAIASSVAGSVAGWAIANLCRNFVGSYPVSSWPPGTNDWRLF